jgi:hypothetical protein
MGRHTMRFPHSHDGETVLERNGIAMHLVRGHAVIFKVAGADSDIGAGLRQRLADVGAFHARQGFGIAQDQG